MLVLYMLTRGTADPTGASVPVHLAVNGSLEVGDQTSIVLAGDATEHLAGDAIETTEGVGVPPMRELVAKLREHEVPVYVWKGCADARGVSEADLAKVDGRYTTPPDVARLITQADRVLTF